MTPEEKAEEIADSWMNGNRTWAIDELEAIRPKRKALATMLWFGRKIRAWSEYPHDDLDTICHRLEEKG